ncbi:Uncharacterised protein [Mycobacteroides abscessus subsp. abscessus]|nr:Uncharacterised protein [Mycobacteroides abscessus subsp. abscessus]
MVDVEVGEKLGEAPNPAPCLTGELAVDRKPMNQCVRIAAQHRAERIDGRWTLRRILDEQTHTELVVWAEISVDVVDEYQHHHSAARAHPQWTKGRCARRFYGSRHRVGVGGESRDDAPRISDLDGHRERGTCDGVGRRGGHEVPF